MPPPVGKVLYFIETKSLYDWMLIPKKDVKYTFQDSDWFDIAEILLQINTQQTNFRPSILPYYSIAKIFERASQFSFYVFFSIPKIKLFPL